MNGLGFDWTKLAVPGSQDGQTSPAPPVSFGFNSNSDLSTSNNTLNTNFFRNQSADQLVAERYGNRTNSGKQDPQYSGDLGESIPLSLTAQDLTLQESKTYMRWYSDILARTNSRTISMADVYNFLNNFKITQEMKEKINKIFHKILHSINIGEFFALLRVISHVLRGEPPRRLLIGIKAPVPKPPSILSKKRQNDEDSGSNSDTDNIITANSTKNESKTLDLDSFTQFMLTGERPDEEPRKRKSKKMKSVKFSDQVVTDVHDSYVISPVGSPLPQPEQLDYSLPMDQLLKSIKQQGTNDTEEREILENMETEMNSFHNLNSVDSASVNGVPSHLDFNKHTSSEQNNDENLLKPNMTGPAQMSAMLGRHTSSQLLQPNMTGPSHMSNFYHQAHYGETPNEDSSPYIENGYNSGLENSIKPLRPNVTGPADMARLFSPTPDRNDSHLLPKVTLQSFTDRMLSQELHPDPVTINHTINNTNVSPLSSTSPLRNRPLPPPPVPAGRRSRSASSPIPRDFVGANTENIYQGLNQNVLGQQSNSPLSSMSNNNSLHPPVKSHQKLTSPPPPPPPSRRKVSNSVSSYTSPPPLPPKVAVDSSNDVYSGNNDSTSNILDDLRALQEEVDKIRDMTGGF